jgi:carboxymethylenebutenolidase
VKQHHPNLTQHVYPAGHGFHCDERASYHKPSAEQAMERSLQFLRQHVG